MRLTGGKEMGEKNSREKQKKKICKRGIYQEKQRWRELQDVLQITLRLEMIADHKKPVAMETSSLQAML